MFNLKQDDVSIRSSIVFLVSVIVVLSIIANGRYNIRLAVADSRGAGVFFTHLLMYPERYADDIARLLTPVGYINPFVMIQYFLYKLLGIDPSFVSYIFVVGGSVTLYLGVFYLSLAFFEDSRLAIITSFFALVFALIKNDLALMGSDIGFQTFPAMNNYALGTILIIFGLLYKDRWVLAMVCMLVLTAIHSGYALLLSPIIGLFFIGKYFFITRQKKLLIKQLCFLIVVLVASSAPGLATLLNVENLIDKQYLYDAMRGFRNGHIYPWQGSFKFISIFSSYGACISLFLIGSRYYSKLNKSIWILFFSIILGSAVYFILHVSILYLGIVKLVHFSTMQPLRTTVYLPLLIFPVVAYMITNSILDTKNNYFLSLLIILFCILSASFLSMGFWILVPVFGVYEFLHTKSDKKNIRILKRNILIAFLIFCSLTVVSLIVNNDYQAYKTLVVILFTNFNVVDFGTPEAISIIRLTSAFIIVISTLIFLRKSNFILNLVNRIKFLKSFGFYGALLLLCLVAFSAVHSFQTFAATYVKRDYIQLYEALKWMNENTPEKSKFITKEFLLQHNGISARATLYPFPYALTPFRVQDKKSQEFDLKMMSYWGQEVGNAFGWLYDVIPAIEEKYDNLKEEEIMELAEEFNASYFVASPWMDELQFETVFKNDRLRIYKLPLNISW
jgi:hypothetical protein